MSIKGYKSQQALQQKLGGYSEDQSIDKLRYTTIQEMSGRRHALDVLVHGAYQITTAPKTIEAGSNIRTIKITNHGASKNDIVRLSNGTQFAALSTPDANTIITSVELDVSPVGDTCTIWRHITPSYNADGSLNVIASQGPVKFNKDGVDTVVNYVTAAPSSSDALPVNIVTVNGQGISTTVDLSGAQINVQLTDRGTSPDSIRIGDGTNLAGVNASNEIKTSDADVLAAVNANGVVSTGNSSTAILGANAVFTGTAIEIKDYSAIAVAAISDVASATNGLSMQFSPDGTNWDHSHSYTSGAGTGLSYTQACELRYFRIVYTNGPIAQTYFRLTVILKRNNTMPSRYTFDQGISGSQLADNTKSVIHGVTTGGGGGYVPVKVNPSGALTVDATISSSALPTGASTSALQTTGNTSLSSIDTKLTSQATAANQATELTRLGDIVETAPATDTASSGLNGRLQRIAQRLTSLIGLFPASIGAKASAASFSVVIASDQGPIGSVQVSSSALPTGAATSANQTSQLAQETNINTALGITSDAAATTDTGTFSIIAFIKRGMTNWTTLLGRVPPALGPQLSTSSLSIIQASSTSFSVVQSVRTPTYAESLVITQASAVTLTAPLTARAMKIQADNTNSVNLRYKIGATPTASSGHQLEPGRSEDWTVAGDVLIIAESTASAQKVYVTWGA